MTDIGKNIKNLRIRRNLSQKALAKLCGWDSNSRIANYEGTGKTKREPTLSDIKKLARVLHVSPAALAFDDFPAFGELPAPTVKGMPILKPNQINSWPQKKQEIIANEKPKLLQDQVILGLNCYVFEVEDDSMFNFITHEGFRKGKKIIVDPNKEYKINDYVLAMKESGLILFRKVIEDDGHLVLSPMNTLGDYSKTVLSDNVKICGVVLAYLDMLI